jgi:hypothetical protein
MQVNPVILAMMITAIVLLGIAQIGQKVGLSANEPGKEEIGDGWFRSIDRELGNVCYRTTKGISCLPLKEGQ